MNALREAGKLSVSLVCELDGVVVGHVAVSPVTISDGSQGWFGLGPISVVPQHQKQGIGTKLMEQALVELKNRGAAGCVLVGEPGFYYRFGFKVVEGLVLPDVPPEYFLALPFSAEIPHGEVMYHEAFSAQE